MSEWTQISLYDRKPAEGVNPVVRIKDQWGVPNATSFEMAIVGGLVPAQFKTITLVAPKISRRKQKAAAGK